MKNIFISLLLVITATTVLLLIPSKKMPAPMPWEVTILPDGNTKIFGIHLGVTNYGQAQRLLHQYGETAIFIQEGQAATVEAFFNSINLGGLSAKLILNIAVPVPQINDMISNALEARLQPSGAHRYTLNNSANRALIDATIIAITYIPSVKLNQKMVRHRFGDSHHIERDPNNSNTEIWHYPMLGLNIQLNDHEKTILQYQSLK